MNHSPTSIQKMQQSGALGLYLEIQRNRMNDALCSRSSTPSDEHLNSVLQMIRTTSGICFTADSFRQILELFPIQRGLIAKYNPEHETDVREAAFDVVAQFFLGTTWPTFGDGIDLAGFLAVLKSQASAMDFVTD